MEHSDKHINWEKLTSQLDGSPLPDGEEAGSATPEEQDMLQLAGKIQTTMKEFDPEERFPAAAGWERLQNALTNDEAPVITMQNNRRKWWLAAASVIAVVTVSVILFTSRKNSDHPIAATKNQKEKSTGKQLADNVKVTLGNGEVVELRGGSKVITDNTGKKIHFNNTQADFSSMAGSHNPVFAINTIEVPRGRTASLIMPDGTRVWINAESVLKFPSVFTGNIREVLLSGEAYFDVARDSKKAFVVKSGSMKVNVLGTRFNAECYYGNQRITLENGSVKVYAANDSTLLKPGEAAEFESLKQHLSKEQVNVREYTAWKDGDIVIRRQSLMQIANMLERSYNYKFNFEDAALKQLHFTLDIPRPTDLKDVLEMLSQSTTGLRFSINGNEVTVRSE